MNLEDWQEKRRRRDEQRRVAMEALPPLRFQHHRTLRGHDGEVLSAASIGPSGEALALWTTPAGQADLAATATQPGWATFPEPKAAAPVQARVTVYRAATTTETVISELMLAHPHLQPLPDDRILMVGARCSWRPAGPDRNAVVYDVDGHVLAEAIFGDGIEHVAATRSGRIWVGYFDEGVYGNYGWGAPDGPTPIGNHGLVRFGVDLTPEYHYPHDTAWDSISDCYALALSDDAAWVCYYAGFPVVRIDGETVTGWDNSLADGVRALAVTDTTVALYGGYGPDHDRLLVAATDGGDLHRLGEYRVVLPDGAPLPIGTHAFGRGPDLHLIVGSDWYRLEMDHLSPGARAKRDRTQLG